MVGEGAREWGKSKGISIPETISEGDAVTFTSSAISYIAVPELVFLYITSDLLSSRNTHWFFLSCTCLDNVLVVYAFESSGW